MLVQKAVQARMDLIAVTDHDTVAGVREALTEGAAQGIQVLSGIELSVGQGQEIHLLGYGLNPENASLLTFLETQLASRRERSLAMVEKLAAMGIIIDPAEAQGVDPRFMGRMPLAQALVRRGYADSVRDAFSRYLNADRPAFVPRERVGVAEGIGLLRSFGATVVIAHPGRSGLDDRFTELLPEWQEAGLAGIEAYHAQHNAMQRKFYDRIARERGLLVTGGSDSHGVPGGTQIGDNLSAWNTVRGDSEALLARLLH